MKIQNLRWRFETTVTVGGISSDLDKQNHAREMIVTKFKAGEIITNQ